MSAPPADPSLLDEAVDLARSAGELTLGWFDRTDLAVATKSDGTPVTEADRAAERYIRERIAEHHPNDAILGEEEADVAGTSGLTWVIDPIDGTKAFTRGVPLYSNLLAVLDDHGPVVGVINLPALGTTVYAGRGLGCFRDGRPVHVSRRAEPPECVLSTSGYSGWPEPALLGVKRAGYQLRTWGDGYGYAMVACGAVEAMVDPEVSLWDIAPLPVVIGEAGGRVSALDGTAPVLAPGAQTSFVATNGLVHGDVIRALNATLG
jgi:histidinol phosphatase-like enzyme (inositol monophosphatase family)